MRPEVPTPSGSPQETWPLSPGYQQEGGRDLSQVLSRPAVTVCHACAGPSSARSGAARGQRLSLADTVHSPSGGLTPQSLPRQSRDVNQLFPPGPRHASRLGGLSLWPPRLSPLLLPGAPRLSFVLGHLAWQAGFHGDLGLPWSGGCGRAGGSWEVPLVPVERRGDLETCPHGGPD